MFHCTAGTPDSQPLKGRGCNDPSKLVYLKKPSFKKQFKALKNLSVVFDLLKTRKHFNRRPSPPSSGKDPHPGMRSRQQAKGCPNPQTHYVRPKSRGCARQLFFFLFYATFFFFMQRSAFLFGYKSYLGKTHRLSRLFSKPESKPRESSRHSPP